MDHWPQLCLLRDAKGQRVLGMGMDDGHDIRPRRENRGMNEALEIKAGALVAYRLTLEVELDDVFGTHQLGSERAGNQKAVGIVRVADADMATTSSRARIRLAITRSWIKASKRSIVRTTLGVAAV